MIDERHASARPSPVRVRILSVLAGALIVLAVSATSAAAAHRDLATACPGPPSGWTSPPSNPQIWGPEQDPGTTQENVNCWYFNAQQQTVMVTAQFALPTDINPVSDFDFGCGSKGSVNWDTSNRQYRVTSDDRWLYVGFNDLAQRALSDSEEKSFEGVAKTLLKNTESSAHACSLKTVPTATRAGWLFDFEFSITANGFVAFGGIGTHTPAQIGAVPLPDGTFTTSGTPRNPKVVQISTPPILVAVVANGKRTSMTLKIVKGLAYTYKLVGNGRVAAATLKAKIKVLRSTEPACKAGSTGTITLATAPAKVSLNLCGSLFRHPSRKSSVTVEEA